MKCTCQTKVLLEFITTSAANEAYWNTNKLLDQKNMNYLHIKRGCQICMQSTNSNKTLRVSLFGECLCVWFEYVQIFSFDYIFLLLAIYLIIFVSYYYWNEKKCNYVCKIEETLSDSCGTRSIFVLYDLVFVHVC